MPTAWFLATYKRDTRGGERGPVRYCAMDDFTAQIRQDGGQWTETEVLGNRAIVKVRATLTTLQTIAATAGFRRLPAARLEDSLADVPVPVRRAIRDELEAMGYPLAEIQAALGTNLDAVTLGDVVRFAARRRRQPRYDAAQDQIMLDGPIQACRDPEDVNRELPDE